MGFFTTLVSGGVPGESIAETVNSVIREYERRRSERRKPIDLGSYRDKFSESGKRVLEAALEESRRRKQNYVSDEHIVWALANVESELFSETMRDLSLDPVVMKMALERRLNAARQQHIGKGFRIGPDATQIFKFAMERARANGRRIIDSEDIFWALTDVVGNAFQDILTGYGVRIDTLIEVVRTQVGKHEDAARSKNPRPTNIGEAYKDKFSESGVRVLEYAVAECDRLGKYSVTLERILDALAKCEPALFDAALRDLSVDPSVVRAAIEARLQDEVVQRARGFRISPETTDLFKRSMERARSQGRRPSQRQIYFMRSRIMRIGSP